MKVIWLKWFHNFARILFGLLRSPAHYLIITPPFFKNQIIFSSTSRKFIKICTRDRIDLRTVYDTFYSRQYSNYPLGRAIHLIDLGGHIGCSVLYFNDIYDLDKIVIAEPNPNNITILERNLNLNGIEANVYNGAILNVNQLKKFSIDQYSDSGRIDTSVDEVRFSQNTKQPLFEVDVQAITFQKLKDKYRIIGDVILKVDIEGAEFELFDDLNLLDGVLIAYIETHDFHFYKPIAYKLFKLTSIENYLIKPNGENFELRRQ